MRIGIIASSGGATFDMARQILADISAPEFCVVTDRACGIEAICAEHGIPHTRIESKDNKVFSALARQWFRAQGSVDFVLLYFLRLITEELFEAFPTFNIHPSLLPAFTGFNPIERAAQSQVRFLGATAHRVDASKDAGPIVAQVTMPIPPSASIEQLHHYSFVQKVYLSVLLAEMAKSGWTQTAKFSDRCNPQVEDPALWNRLLQFQRGEGVEVLA